MEKLRLYCAGKLRTSIRSFCILRIPTQIGSLSFQFLVKIRYRFLSAIDSCKLSTGS